MLAGFRKASQHWVVKIMFGLLTLSFGAWGIGDILEFHGSSTPGLVVGDDKIGPDVVARQFQQDLQQIQQQTGGQKLSAQDAIQFGLLDQTIQRLASDSLLTQAGQSLNMTVDDNTLRQSIAAIPAFQNEMHQFDLNNYHAALDQAGMSEAQFIASQRDTLMRSFLMNAVTGGVVVPPAMLDPLFAYREEKRVAQTITISAAAMPAPPAPADQVLQDYYKAHGSQFTVPEMREVSAIVIRTADIAAGIKPTDADIQQAYQARQGDFATPEKRSIQQVLFTDQAQAQKLVDAVRGGQPFAAAVTAAGKQTTDLGTVDRTGLPLPVLADAAFSTPSTGVAGPIQSPLGWHVLYVSAITPAAAQPLAQVRDGIVSDLVASMAQDKMSDLGNKVDDQLGSGAALEEVASKLNLKLVKIGPMDESGKGPDGNQAANLPQSAVFLQDAFAGAPGAPSDLDEMENGQGYFVLRVDKVTPPSLKPYDSVKSQVLSAWTLAQQQDEARKAADQDAMALTANQPIEKVAGKFALATTEPFTRSGSDSVNPLIAAAMFAPAAKVGTATTVTVGDDAVVARLQTVIPANVSADTAAFQQTSQQLGQALIGDIANQYVAALQQQMPVRINQDAINAQIQQPQQ